MTDRAILTINGLSRQFGGLAALYNLSMEILDGEILGIIGPNGAGKTTLINAISGIHLPTRGDIFLEGKKITLLPAYERCRLGIARTFQLAKPLEDLNVMENIMLGALFGQRLSKRSAARTALEICDFVGLADVQRALARLSVLDIKKMEIGRALASRPRLLFLDEVMAGLNADETADMIQLVRKIRDQGVTIGIVEHVMGVIKELSHRVVVLNFGELLAFGRYEDVANNRQVIEAYLGEDT
jgi:branched-chain amino acid transport system ATP-binding protein